MRYVGFTIVVVVVVLGVFLMLRSDEKGTSLIEKGTSAIEEAENLKDRIEERAKRFDDDRYKIDDKVEVVE